MKKKLLLLISICVCTFSKAQIEIVPNPFDINTGTLTFKYGENGDYSIFDPQSDPNLYLYTGLQTDADPATWDYHDDFTDVNTLIPLTYNATLGYYEASFNPATRSYLEEPSLNTTTIPSGTQVYDWYFLIRNADGSRQSADLYGTDYGYGSSAYLSANTNSKNKNVLVYNGVIKFLKQDTYKIDVYNILGKLILENEIVALNNELVDLSLQQKGVYIVKIKTQESEQVFKMIKS